MVKRQESASVACGCLQFGSGTLNTLVTINHVVLSGPNMIASLLLNSTLVVAYLHSTAV